MISICDSTFTCKWTSKLKAKPTALAFSTDSKTLIVGDRQGSIYAFDLLSGKLLLTYQEKKAKHGSILALDLHEQHLYCFNSKGLFTKWSFPDLKKLKESSIAIKANEIISHALFKPIDNSLIFVATSPGCYIPDSKIFQISLDQFPNDYSFEFDRQSNAIDLPLADMDNHVDAIALSKDGHKFIVTRCTSSSGDWPGQCATYFPQYISIPGSIFYDRCISNGRSKIPEDHIKNIASFSPDGKQILVSANDDNCLYFIDCAGSILPDTDPIEAYVTSLDWAPVGNLIAAGSYNGEIVFWNSLDGQQICVKKLSNSAIEIIKFSPDGAFVAAFFEKQVAIIKSLS